MPLSDNDWVKLFDVEDSKVLIYAQSDTQADDDTFVIHQIVRRNDMSVDVAIGGIKDTDIDKIWDGVSQEHAQQVLDIVKGFTDE
jgi:hypothetical protein